MLSTKYLLNAADINSHSICDCVESGHWVWILATLSILIMLYWNISQLKIRALMEQRVSSSNVISCFYISISLTWGEQLGLRYNKKEIEHQMSHGAKDFLSFFLYFVVASRP